MGKIKIYSAYTNEMEAIKHIFLNTMQDDWEVNLTYLGNAGEGNGDFHTRGWLDVQKRKLEFIIGKIEENLADVIIWSDLDIQFFAECTPLIRRAIEGKDVLYQAERWPRKDEVNIGFAVIRCNEQTLALYRMALQYNLDELQVADQAAINDILAKNRIDIKWDILPKQFWAMSHYLYDNCVPPADVVLHHANCTSPQTVNGKMIGSVELKLQQFELVKGYIHSNRKNAAG
ncbi:MAG: hypothetical protein J0H74_12805 [Chitinophagaceae bacterium]|nr:hypothetical protein [Chitinophagaceae bacterium]